MSNLEDNQECLNGETNVKPEEFAIDIRNAFFEYKKDVTILDDLSLQVPTGKIFALLGPNGTGKTTLIHNILGRLQLKSGSIRVFGTPPGSKYSDIPGVGVGFMPQELALFEEFTIKEILTYYGTIYDLNGELLKQRIDDLMQILNLPEKSRPINKLSGGQQRRVSIAVTMIHRPRLIILDEPTVGVDSLLRHRIWEYLEGCCAQNGQTVLITTHYIEEAKSAANVAFMSYGTILKQSDPQTLLQEYNCQTLETVFLILCQRKQQKRKSIKLSEILCESEQTIDESVANELPDPDPNNDPGKQRLNNKSFNLKRVKATLMKNCILSVRKPAYLYMFYLFPFLILSTMEFAIGQYPAHIPMVIYNEDQNPQYSQIIIDSIDSYHIDVRKAPNNETAYESVVNGTNFMSVVFGKNFSDNFEYRMRDVFDITDEELDSTNIKVYVDFSNPVMGIFVLKYLLRAFNKFLSLESDALGLNAQRFFHLVSVEEPIYGEFEFNLAEVFGPGILLVLCQLFPLIVSSLQMVFEKKNSCLQRVLVSGVRPVEIFVSHFMQNCILIATQVLLTVFVAFGVYGNTQIGSYLDVYLLLFLIGIQGMAFGFLIAMLIQTEVGILAGIGLLILPLWLISGVFWPIEAIPQTFLALVKFGPLCQPILALRAIMFRGWTINQPVVYFGFIINVLYIVIISFVDIFLFNKSTS